MHCLKKKITIRHYKTVGEYKYLILKRYALNQIIRTSQSNKFTIFEYRADSEEISIISFLFLVVLRPISSGEFRPSPSVRTKFELDGRTKPNRPSKNRRLRSPMRQNRRFCRDRKDDDSDRALQEEP